MANILSNTLSKTPAGRHLSLPVMLPYVVVCRPGAVRILDGQIQIEDKTITGVAEIDLNSIENMNLEGDELQSVLVSHLKSEDFFIEANAQFLSQLSLEESQTFHAYKCPSKSLCLGRKEIIHHPPRDWREYMKKILSDFGKARAREELKKN